LVGVGGRLTLESAVSGIASIACHGVPAFEGLIILGEMRNLFWTTRKQASFSEPP